MLESEKKLGIKDKRKVALAIAKLDGIKFEKDIQAIENQLTNEIINEIEVIYDDFLKMTYIKNKDKACDIIDNLGL